MMYIRIGFLLMRLHKIQSHDIVNTLSDPIHQQVIPLRNWMLLIGF